MEGKSEMAFEQVINVVISAVISGIISFVVGFLAAKFYGPRWVELSKRRRDHSVILNNEVFKPWLAKLEEYCEVGAVFDLDVDKLVSIEPKNPTDLEFFAEAKSHLEPKYLDILNAWEELEGATLEHNKELATFLEKIRTLIVKEVAMPCYYRGMRGDQPKRYVRPDLLALHIYQIITHEIRTGRQWFGGKPKIQSVTYHEGTFYELKWWNERPLASHERKEVEKYVPFIIQLVETPNYRSKAKNLLEKEAKVLRPKRADFQAKMTTLIKSIALGNVIRGKCQHCPKEK